ncbi:unnamed protein product [Ectocarpus sp. 12 AP-2014]
MADKGVKWRQEFLRHHCCLYIVYLLWSDSLHRGHQMGAFDLGSGVGDAEQERLFHRQFRASVWVGSKCVGELWIFGTLRS